MTAIKLDGLATAKAIKAELAKQVVELKSRGINPGLGTLLVGDDPGSHKYVAGKHRDCEEIGVHSVRIDLPSSASAADIRAAIRDLNDASDVTGYIIQLPLPVGIDANEMLELIDPSKDADGLRHRRGNIAGDDVRCAAAGDDSGNVHGRLPLSTQRKVT